MTVEQALKQFDVEKKDFLDLSDYVKVLKLIEMSNKILEENYTKLTNFARFIDNEILSNSNEAGLKKRYKDVSETLNTLTIENNNFVEKIEKEIQKTTKLVEETFLEINYVYSLSTDISKIGKNKKDRVEVN